ncbi:MAG: class I SAM-dependent methyltransferase [Bacteroidales bacterium]|nr:class I SAM-dependent methyltransferase [Bacteroidales bacterium]
MSKIIKFILKYLDRPTLLKVSKIIMPVIKYFYIGKKFKCPICNFTARKFLPYGYGKNFRNNRLCPACFSLERHRLIWLYLKNKTRFFNENLKVLHVAPEQPFINRFKKLTNLHYITCDLFSPLAEIKADIRSLPFSNNEFDIIICNHVLEHIDDDIKAMSELFRVLKPKGFAILQVPINYSYEKTYENKSITTAKEREVFYGQYDHVRIYGKDYPLRLKSVGFIVDEVNYISELSEEDVRFFVLDASEIIYIGSKNE